MDAIDSDDNSIVGFSLGGNMSELDSRDINKNGEIKSNSLGSSFQLLGIDFNRLMEVSLDKLKRPITDGKEQLEGCRELEKLSQFPSVFVTRF